MPNVKRTTGRVVRISDELWAAAQARAATDSESVSDVVRKALAAYVGFDLTSKPAVYGRKDREQGSEAGR